MNVLWRDKPVPSDEERGFLPKRFEISLPEKYRYIEDGSTTTNLQMVLLRPILTLVPTPATTRPTDISRRSFYWLHWLHWCALQAKVT